MAYIQKNNIFNRNKSISGSSPLHMHHESWEENNARLNTWMDAHRKKVTDEMKHIADVKSNVSDVSEKAKLGDESDYLNSVNLIDQKTKNLISKNVVDGVNQGGTGWGCVSMSCSIARAAEARIPQNPEGGIWLNQLGREGKGTFHKSGDPFPTIWNNQYFDANAAKLGYKLIENPENVEEGDIIRQGYLNTDKGDGNSGTYHSVMAVDNIATPDVANDTTGTYISAIDKGMQYNWDDAVKNVTGKYKSRDAVQRYVGSMPYYDELKKSWLADPNNKRMDISRNLPKAEIIMDVKPSNYDPDPASKLLPIRSPTRTFN